MKPVPIVILVVLGFAFQPIVVKSNSLNQQAEQDTTKIEYWKQKAKEEEARASHAMKEALKQKTLAEKNANEAMRQNRAYQETVKRLNSAVDEQKNAQSSDWIIVPSAHSAQQTIELLQKAIQEKGFKIFNTIDHAQGAESVGLTLRPTTLIIFGNPKGGTPLMNCDQRMGIILPLKILAWEDESKQVKAGFINPEKYAKEYNLEKCQEVLLKMKSALQGLLSTVEKK